MTAPKQSSIEMSKSSLSPPPTSKEDSHNTPRKGIRWFVHAPTFPTSPGPKRSSSKTPTKRVSWANRSKKQHAKPKEPSQQADQALIEQLRGDLAEAREHIQRLEQQQEATTEEHLVALHDISDEDGSSEKLFFRDDSSSTYEEESASLPVDKKKCSAPIITKENVPATDDPSSADSYTELTDHAAALTEITTTGLSTKFLTGDTHIYPGTSSSVIWHTIAFENSPLEINDSNPSTPPTEVFTIRDQSIPTNVDQKDMPKCLKDAELRAQAYRAKLEKADDLVASLFRDLDRARRCIYTLVSHSKGLNSQIKGIKLYQEDNTIHRSALVKACAYVSPVFILGGGFYAFVTTILFVWVLVEIDSGLTTFDNDAEKN